MSDAAPAAGAAAEEKKKPLLRRLRRPPTAVLVTLLGIVLTAWLLPAVTRQWNDRQSAHTVQAGIVSDMTAITARALQEGDALWASVPDCDPSGYVNVLDWAGAKLPQREKRCFSRGQQALAKASEKIDRPWSLSSAEIEARMRAYLDPGVVTAWQVFSWFMGEYDGSFEIPRAVGHGWLELKEAAESGFNLPAAAARSVGGVLETARSTGIYDGRRVFAGDDIGKRLVHLRNKLRSSNVNVPTYGGLHPVGFYLPPAASFGQLEIDLSGFEQEIAQEVLNSHVTGYSTTTHDLIHDLIP